MAVSWVDVERLQVNGKPVLSYLLVKFDDACRQVVKQQLPDLMPAQKEWIPPILCMQQLCLLMSVLHLSNKVAVKIIPCHTLLDRKPTFFESAAFL